MTTTKTTKPAKTYKVFWEHLWEERIARPYMRDIRVFHTNMGVETFTNEQEMLEFADKKADYGIACYIIDYKADKGIGPLARHINQCYGCGEDSYYRDLGLVDRMYEYIEMYDFPCVFPILNKSGRGKK